MDMTRRKFKGTMTVEASFIMSFIVLVLMFQTGYALVLYRKVVEFGAACMDRVSDSETALKIMRLTRFGIKYFGGGQGDG